MGPSGNSIYIWFKGGKDGNPVDISNTDLCANYFNIVTSWKSVDLPLHHWRCDEVITCADSFRTMAAMHGMPL